MMNIEGQNKNATKSQRRKVTNLEHEVDSIFAEEATDGEEEIKYEYIAKTPSRAAKPQQQFSTPVVLPPQSQTPRRSNRKSIKPAQDYADIVGKSCVRADAKDNENENEETEKGDHAPKWTQMEVGRVSKKRGRKSRKTAEKKRNKIEAVDNVENDDELVQENIPDDMEKQDVNQELDQRKSVQQQEDVTQNEDKTGANEEKVEMPPMKENFGAYLKSNKLNVSDLDLGLKPLPLSQDEQENGKIVTVETVQNEMTDKIENTVDKVECKKVDEKDEQEITHKLEQLPLQEEPADQPSMEDDDMQPLQLSDDDECEEVEPPKAKAPRIVLTNTDDQVETILATPLPQQQALGTPQKHSKGYRFPTPYKVKGNFAFNKGDKGLSVTTLEPREIIQRSIRKRSLSVCIAPKRNVTFHSPANQTLVIEEIDLLIAKSTKKKAAMAKDTNVTMRRKRSMSFDDTMMMTSKLPKPGFIHHIASIKSNQGPQKGGPSSRTKLPNFAQIHQKNFNKMESLVDHVTRKAERAKILTNSASKMLTASSNKGLSARNQLDSTSNKNEKPKALKKIDLLGIQTKPSSAPQTAVENEVENVASSLPNPQMALIKPIQSSSSCTFTSKKSAQKAAPKRAPISTKPRFNLSTSLLPKAVRQAPPTAPIPVPAPLIASTSAPSDKIATRRQRHMDMFKGRTAADTHTDGRNGAIIRGVRSNRRFDLQMQHRRNLEHN